MTLGSCLIGGLYLILIVDTVLFCLRCVDLLDYWGFICVFVLFRFAFTLDYAFVTLLYLFALLYCRLDTLIWIWLIMLILLMLCRMILLLDCLCLLLVCLFVCFTSLFCIRWLRVLRLVGNVDEFLLVFLFYLLLLFCSDLCAWFLLIVT